MIPPVRRAANPKHIRGARGYMAERWGKVGSATVSGHSPRNEKTAAVGQLYSISPIYLAMLLNRWRALRTSSSESATASSVRFEGILAVLVCHAAQLARLDLRVALHFLCLAAGSDNNLGFGHHLAGILLRLARIASASRCPKPASRCAWQRYLALPANRSAGSRAARRADRAYGHAR